jgi:methyltransferase (TIGR00027 family)
LIEDEFAADLAGDLGRDLLYWKEQHDGREDALLPIRTCWFDGAVLAALPRARGQLVELGSGLDTRPYRVALPTTTHTFELDQEPVLRREPAVLAGRHASHGVVSDAAIDLNTDWAPHLLGVGFEPSQLTIWVAEGLMMYLSLDAGVRLLDTLAGLSRTGSTLILDTLARPERSCSGREGSNVNFCPDDLGRLLLDHGWTVRVQATIAPSSASLWPNPDRAADSEGANRSLLVPSRGRPWKLRVPQSDRESPAAACP